MRKQLLTVLLVTLTCGFLFTSCHKDNLQTTTATAKHKGSASGTVSTPDASADPANDHPSGCSHGG